MVAVPAAATTAVAPAKRGAVVIGPEEPPRQMEMSLPPPPARRSPPRTVDELRAEASRLTGLADRCVDRGERDKIVARIISIRAEVRRLEAAKVRNWPLTQPPGGAAG